VARRVARQDGGTDGEVGGGLWLDGKGRGGEGKMGPTGRVARRGGGGGGVRQMGFGGCPLGRGVARRDRDVARPGGCPMGWEGVPDGDLWGLDGMGGCPNGKDARDGRGGCPIKGEG
jgi:hypothetical protein